VDEVIIDGRGHGESTRQSFPGENLGPGRLSADTDTGVPALRIPVSEQSRPRQVELGSSHPPHQDPGATEAAGRPTSTSETATPATT
jgi:HSP20 family protein